MSPVESLTGPVADRSAAPPRPTGWPQRQRWIPWTIAAVVAATIAFGETWAAAGGFLGTDLPPFTLGWQPAVSPYALVAILALGAGAWLAPALYASRLGPIAFGTALAGIGAVLRLALNLSRVGPSDWSEVFVVHSGTGEGRHVVPAGPALHPRRGRRLPRWIRPDRPGAAHASERAPTRPAGHPRCPADR